MIYAWSVKLLLLDQAGNEIREAADAALWAGISPFDVARSGTNDGVDAWLNDAVRRGVPRVVFRPGLPPEPARTDRDPYEAAEIEAGLRAWPGAGSTILHEGLRRLEGVAVRLGLSVLVLPQVGSLVSDIPGLLGLQRRFENIGVLLEPAAMLPPGHASHAPDFFDRMGAMLEFQRPAGILLGNLNGRPLDTGPLDPRCLAPLARLAIEAVIPLVLRGDRTAAERQLASLGDASLGYS